ncbi:hypothetical protein Vadar_011499 [Vaccinium darrowii]|uniref:Uncharacterized protein n=1 Tax=Vaccinium darrowii TaxID=229202 RepID=A0ACB7WZZ4_9ERIC|nr:hypothetical protein Vadar_011499 [Vaccinium darrowii]
MLVRVEDNDNPENALISAIYPSIQENFDSAEYITKSAILAPKNKTVDMLNGKLIELFPGPDKTNGNRNSHLLSS